MQSFRLPWGRMMRKKWIWMTKMMRTILKKERSHNPEPKPPVYRVTDLRMRADRWGPAGHRSWEILMHFSRL